MSFVLCSSLRHWFSRRPILAIFLLGFASFAQSNANSTDETMVGRWTAELTCPGGVIRFEIDLQMKDNKLVGSIVNGSERIPIQEIESSSTRITIKFPHYDSAIKAELNDKNGLVGTWTKVVGQGKKDVLRFKATQRARKYHTAGAKSIAGRYAVKFESSDDLAIGIFKQHDEFLAGTFLTTTGDYRYLAGSYVEKEKAFRLTCFDGGHAFLFTAKVLPDNSLKGDFWSRGSWHETWTAKKNDTIKLADGFQQVKWAGVATSDLSFPDERGMKWNLADERFKGKVKILYVFGSWCPNCHDASVFLNELQRDYGAKGMSIVGLAFELTSDHDRSVRQIKNYRERTNTTFPILIAGMSNKTKATQQLRILSRVKSYPTTIFLDENDRPIAIHSGFTGPATGDAYKQLQRRFRKIIEKQLLAK